MFDDLRSLRRLPVRNAKAQKVPFRKRPLFEALEARILLSADLATGGVAAAIYTGLNDLKADADALLNSAPFSTPLPIVAQQLLVDNNVVQQAQTIKDLLAAPVDINLDGTIAGGGLEHDLDLLDTSGDGRVDIDEVLDDFFGKLTTGADRIAAFSGDLGAYFNQNLFDKTVGGFSLDVSAVDQSDASHIAADLDIQLSFAQQTGLDLGLGAEALGLSLDALSLDVTGVLVFQVRVGVNTSGEIASLSDLYLDNPASGNAMVSAMLDASLTTINGGLSLGFLSASVAGGSITMHAEGTSNLVDPRPTTATGFTTDPTANSLSITGASDVALGGGPAEFTLRIGSTDARSVSVGTYSAANDVQTALNNAGLGTLVTASESANRLTLALDSTLSAANLGFAEESSSTNILNATAGPTASSAAKLLFSLDHALPKLVAVADTGTTAVTAAAALKAALATAGFATGNGNNGIDVTVSSGGNLRVTYDNHDLTITRNLTLESQITRSDLQSLGSPAALFAPVSTAGAYNVDLPFTVAAGLSGVDVTTTFDVSASGDPFALTLPTPDINGDTRASFAFTVNAPGLSDFTNLTASSFVSLLGQLRTQLGSLSSSALFDTEIPFSGTTVGEVLDFTQMVSNQLLYDNGADGVKDGDATLLFDVNKALADAGLGKLLHAENAGNRLLLVAAPSVGSFSIDSNAAALGFGAGGSSTSLLAGLQTLQGGVIGVSPASATFTVTVNGTAHQVQYTTSTNTAFGDDRWRLLDPNNAPTFSSAQELAKQLTFMFPLFSALPRYDSTSKELKYNIKLDYDLAALTGVPLDFSIPLGPLGGITSSSTLDFSASTGLELTLGVFLGGAGSSGTLLTPTTTLASLNNNTGAGIKTDWAVTLPTDVTTIVGVLPNDGTATPDVSYNAVFKLGYDAVAPVTVTLTAQSTLDNTLIGHLVSDLQTAVNAAIGSGHITVGNDGNRLTLTGIGGVTKITLAEVNTVASGQLGLTNRSVDRVGSDPLVVTAGKDAPTLVGRLTATASFTLDGHTVTVAQGDTTDNKTMLDLVGDVQRAVAAVDTGGGVMLDTLFDVSNLGNRLVFTPKSTSGITSFTVGTGSNSAQLGISAAANSNQDDFVIVTSTGVRLNVALDNATDVGDLLTAINTATGNAGKVVASISADGTQIILTDTTFVSGNQFHVELVNGSAAAIKLGILKTDGTPPAALPDGKIESTALGGLTLAQRFFIENASVDGEFLLSAPTVDATAQFGFVDISLLNQAGGGIYVGAKAALSLTDPTPSSTHPERIYLPDLVSGLSPANIGNLVDLSLTPATGQPAFGSIKLKLAVGGGTLLGTAVSEVPINLTLNDLAFFGLQASAAGAPTTITLDGNHASLISVGQDALIRVGGTFKTAKVATVGPFSVGQTVITLDTDLGLAAGTVPNLALFGSIDTGFDGLSGLLPDFKNLSLGDVITGLRTALGFLSSFEEFDFLNEPLPIVNTSVHELVSVADRFAAALDDFENNPAGSVQKLDAKLKEALGLPASSTLVNISVVDKILKLSLKFDKTFSTALGVSLDIPGFSALAGSADLGASGRFVAGLSVGVGLDDPTQVYLFNDTGLAGTLQLTGDALNFRAAVGPLGLFIKDGTATIGGNQDGGDALLGGTADDRLFFADINPATFVNGHVLLSNVLGNLSGSIRYGVGAGVDVVLPVYFPTESLKTGEVHVNGGIAYNSGSGFSISGGGVTAWDQAGTTQIAFGDLLAFDPSKLSVFDNLRLAIDGIDTFLGGLQELLSGDLFSIKFPIIGDKLGDAANFIADFRDTFITRFKDEVDKFADPNQNLVSQALFDLLGPSGLDILLDSDGVAGLSVSDVVLTILDDNPGTSANESGFQWNLALGGQLLDVGAGIGFDIGLPGLGLKTEGGISLNIDWSLNFGFGLDLAEGFFLDISDPHELTVSANVTLLPGAALTGSLAFLQLRAEDNSTNPTIFSATFEVDINHRGQPGDTRLTLDELGKIGITPKVAASAHIDLDLELGLNKDLFGPVVGGFPKIVAEFVLDWALDDGAGQAVPISQASNALSQGLRYVAFEDVGLDMGSFIDDVLGPIVKEIQKVTEPLQPIIDILTTPIPVISDLAGPTTLLDLAKMLSGNKAAFGFIDSVIDIVNLVNSIPVDAGSIVVPLGSFALIDRRALPPGIPGLLDPSEDLTNGKLDLKAGFSGKVPTFSAGAFAGLLDSSSQVGGSGDNKKLSKDLLAGKSGSGFSFPLFDDPSQVFNLLLGQDVTLLHYQMAPLTFDFEYTAFFSIFGPLGVSLNGEVGIDINLGFGYDTFGIREFVDGGFRNPLQLLDGFYVDDLNATGQDIAELAFQAGIWAAAELNLGVARAGVAGGIFATVDFNLHDNDMDGKVRLQELLGNILDEFNYGEPALSPLAIFDIYGRVYAKLFAFLKIDLFLISIDKSWNITPEITIAEFNDNFVRSPLLATELDTGDLQLNMGQFAALRLNGDVSDGNENFTVTQDSVAGNGDVTVNVNAFGFNKKYVVKNGHSIIANMGEGNDTLTGWGVTSGNVLWDISGGAGDDHVYLTDPGNAANKAGGRALIHGDEGDDTLYGGGADDLIYGDLGNDEAHGGAGADIVFGDDGSFTGELTNWGSAPKTTQWTGRDIAAGFSLKDGDDTLFGDDGNDILIGSGGVDIIHGGADNDLIVGDNGIIERDASGVVLLVDGVYKVKNTNLVKGGAQGAPDTLYGDGGNDQIWGGQGDDHIYGDDGTGTSADGNDRIFGEDGNDTLKGGLGNDLIYGAAGNDVLEGQGGIDRLWGNEGNDTLRGGTEGDFLYGGDGADKLHGDAGPDELYGDQGPDYLDGGTGNDRLDGGQGDDTVLGGDNNDLIFGGLGSDILDGQEDGDQYIIGTLGGKTDGLTTIYDTGVDPESDFLTIDGTTEDDLFLLRSMVPNLAGHSTDPEHPDTGFVAKLNNGGQQVERYNYWHLEGITLNLLYGDDSMYSDDTAATFTVNGGPGKDFFQIGQVFQSLRAPQDEPTNNIADAANVYATLAVTRGFLSRGISQPMVINGGTNDDAFVVFHNLAVLTLNGGSGNDDFTVRAFALEGSTDSERGRTDMKGDAGADSVRYAVNAPVGIDGGDGFDTLSVIGTEFSDDFVVTSDGVFGGGLNVSYVNIERLRVDAAEGNDRFFVLSTGGNVFTEIDGGLGSDTFFVGGSPDGAPIPVVSNDLRGYSQVVTGVVATDVLGRDTAYDGITVPGFSANIADDDESFIVVRESNGFSQVTEDLSSLIALGTADVEAWDYDTYTVVLTRAPNANETVRIAIVPQDLSAEDQAKGFKGLEFWNGATWVDAKDLPALEFTAGTFNAAQTVKFRAASDLVAEGKQFFQINHNVTSVKTNTSLSMTAAYAEIVARSVKVQVNDNDQAGVIVAQLDPTALAFDTQTGVTEGGNTDRFAVVLTRAPTADVIVTLSTFLAGATGVDLSSSALTFTSGNYYQAQIVTVTAHQDGVVEGSHTDYINGAVTSADIVANQSASYFIDTDLTTAFIDPIPVTKPASQVLLKHDPIVGVNNAGVTVKLAGVTLAANQFLIDGNTLVFLNAATGKPTNVSGSVEVSYDYAVVKYGSGGVESMDRVVVNVVDDDTQGVRIIESGGSTDLIEGSSATDTFSVVLTKAPAAGTTVYVDVSTIATRSTNGATGAARFETHALLSADGGTAYAPLAPVSGTGVDPGSQKSTVRLAFTDSNWNDPTAHVVTIQTINDSMVEGHDTKVFVPGLNTLNGIQGPLDIEGAAGNGSLSLPPPQLLPGELNLRTADGALTDFVPYSGAEGLGAVETMTVTAADLLPAIQRELNDGTKTLADLQELIGKTLTMTSGPATAVLLNPPPAGQAANVPVPTFDRFWEIVGAVDNGDGSVTFSLKNPGQVDATAAAVTSALPAAGDGYSITHLASTFFAAEKDQIDYTFIFDQDNVADKTGAFSSLDVDPTAAVQTKGWINGFGMSPDLTINSGGQSFSAPGGIIYGDMEVLDARLGSGIDTVTVDYTTFVGTGSDHTTRRTDPFFTLTTLDTGAGNDVVTVNLAAGASGDFAVRGNAGNDTVNAAASTLGVVIFGDLGNDTLTGGAGDDTIFGDTGRIDYINDQGKVVTRLGQTWDTNPVNPIPTGATTTTLTDANIASTFEAFPTDYDGLNGLVVQAIESTPEGVKVQSRTIVSNTADTVTISAPWDVVPLTGANDWFYRIVMLPESQNDAVFRGPLRIESVFDDQGGNDTIVGNEGDDTLIGGANDGGVDLIYGDDMAGGGTGNDRIAGDGARIDLVPLSGNDGPTVIDTFKTQGTGLGGVDHIGAGGGNDTVLAGFGADTVDGNAGEDLVLGDEGVLNYRLGDTDSSTLDRITTGDAATGGVDTIHGNADDDILIGGAAGDFVYGDAEADVVVGDGVQIDFVAGTLVSIRSIDFATGGIDTLQGNADSDIVIGGAEGDSINAGDGDNIVLGDSGELLYTDAGVRTAVRSLATGTGGVDTIDTGTGTDLVIGGADGDTIRAGEGNNTVLGDSGELLYTAAAGILTHVTSLTPGIGGIDRITTGSGIDLVIGGAEGDTINAGNGDNIVLGDSGELLYTDAGIQTAIRSLATDIGGVDIIDTGTGTDRILGGAAGDTIRASDGNNIVLGDSGELLYSTAGIRTAIRSLTTDIGGGDTISSGTGTDILIGGAFGDEIHAGLASDLVAGDSLEITFDAAGQLGDATTAAIATSISVGIGDADTIYGDAGRDLIVGGAAGDTVYGGTEDDVIYGDNARFTFQTAQPTDKGFYNAWGGYLRQAVVINPTVGDSDSIEGNAGNDYVIGGTGQDFVKGDTGIVDAAAGDGNDVLFGDHATIDFTAPWITSFTSTFIGGADGGADDLLYGNGGNDAVLGGQGADVIFGNDGDDDIWGGHNVADGFDAGDKIDAGAGFDVVLGDNGTIVRRLSTGANPGEVTGTDIRSPLDRALIGSTLYTRDTTPGNVGGILIGVSNSTSDATWQEDPFMTKGVNFTRNITLFNHVVGESADHFGADTVAGGGGNDLVFGQMGNDTLAGDGKLAVKPTSVTNLATSLDLTKLVSTATDAIRRVDGDDYVEGNDGNDAIYGGNGQDDLIGGSSTLFGLDSFAKRHDGSDTIFGGDGPSLGAETNRNDVGDGATAHAVDADFILGDNGNLFRVTHGANGAPAFQTFVYDDGSYDASKRVDGSDIQLIPRVVELVDYTVGGPDYVPGSNDNGASDFLHGESGNDYVHGMTGDDVIFGEGQDDDLFGGWGNDWISGGTGDDGILGDDGLLSTTRNGSIEPLWGLTTPTVQTTISTPGNVQTAVINVAGTLKRTADLQPFNLDPTPGGQDPLFDPAHADDILYGGWGSDAIHGGAGDDAVSGAEALPFFYDNATAATAASMADPTTRLNPGNVLGYDPETGEFAYYDEFHPRQKIGTNDVTFPDLPPFPLNFEKTEGPLVTGSTTIHSDGDDKIFGDLGNDWIVGGTGKDAMYGGWGDDLLNADDDQDTGAGLNDAPDTHSTYEDRAYGGSGRDVLIANTGGDRLIDWVGEFNSYLVPFAPFGNFTISRTIQPQLPEFLYKLSEADGADPTRGSEAGNPARNGEPDGELGVVIQKDLAWHDQTGAPRDPQAGNLPGGKRDVLRSADFNNGTMQNFAVDSGVFSVQGGALQVAAASKGQDAAAVYQIGDALPIYFEMTASISSAKATGGWNANGFLIFDYVSKTDFKFAGLDVSTNKMVMGHRTASGWVYDAQAPFTGGVKANTVYNVFLQVNGTTAVLTVNNKELFSHTYAPRVVDGVPFALNYGLVGLGSNNAQGTFDNVAVQIVPPPTTLLNVDDFSTSKGLMTGPAVGAFTLAGNALSTTAAAGANNYSLVQLPLNVEKLAVSSLLDLTMHLSTDAQAGFIYDYYNANHYKFVTIDVLSGKVLMGHATNKGLVIDTSVAKGIVAGTSYELALVLRGTSVSVSVNGAFAVSFAYNANVIDGRFGVFAGNGSARYDDVTLRTNDPVFAVAKAPLFAEAAATTMVGTAVAQDDAQRLLDEAVRRWLAVPGLTDAQKLILGSLQVIVADLDGLQLGETRGDTIWIDVIAAGTGWFIDNTAGDDREFRQTGDSSDILMAKGTSPAAGKMDLLTVLMHEVGHAIGIAHDADDLMAPTLAAGERILPPGLSPVMRAAMDDEPVAYLKASGNDGHAAATRASSMVAWDSSFAVQRSPFRDLPLTRPLSTVPQFHRLMS